MDRSDGNVTKKFNESFIADYAYTFQEAVEELPDRHAADIRILFLPRMKMRKRLMMQPTALSEPRCICNNNMPGCALIFSVRFPNNWSYEMTTLANKIGQTLGVDKNDDEFSSQKIDPEKLIMLHNPSREASVWSPEARKRINKHDNSCLCRIQHL